METIDRVLFTLKHWQMFVITLAACMLNAVFFVAEPGWRGVVGDCLLPILSIAWSMLLGARLRAKLPQYYSVHYALFIVSGVILAVTVLLISIFRDKLPSLLVGKGWIGATVAILVLVMSIAFVGFVARAMKSLETHDKATVSDYARDFFLWCIWWIGVWILVPRLNRLYDQFYR